MLLLALGVLALAGCSNPQRRSAPPPPTPPQVAEFLAHLHADSNHEWLEDESANWLAAQPTEIRVPVAERALSNTDPMVRLLAPMHSYVIGMDDRGDAALAELARAAGERGTAAVRRRPALQPARRRRCARLAAINSKQRVALSIM